MKRLFPILISLILLLLLIPFPMKLKDGGSVHYNAVLYDVYDLHAMYAVNSDTEMDYVEGIIIEILGFQIYNSTDPHIDKFGDCPDLYFNT